MSQIREDDYRPSARQRYSFVLLDIVFGVFLVVSAFIFYGSIFK